MKHISVMVIDPVGLHARPATIAVNLASKYRCNIILEFEGRSTDMKSIMGIMALGIAPQSLVTIYCDGEDEDVALKSIEETLRLQKVIS